MAVAHEAAAPLRRLLLGPGRRLTMPRHRFLRYAVPLLLLAALGLAAANTQYLSGNRDMPELVAVLLSGATVLPLVLVVRNPIVAWRVAYPMLFFGTLHARASESWPWSPVQIIGFLATIAVLAATETAALTFWATTAAVVVPFLYTDQANAYGFAALMVVVALAGDVVARRRTGRRELARQAELTERERSRRALLEERARIAREMHDVVAHHMSMIAVQAETAPYRHAGLPEPARAELESIARSARSALTEMRRLLGTLRAETGDAMRAPQPGLADVPALVETARRAGMSVAYDGDPCPGVPDPTGLAVYRIAQEALANAARHAAGGTVEVRLRADGGSLALTVRNSLPPGDPVTPARDGHGLVGMRERAELLGGSLSAGPDDRGGYLVRATLPYEPEGPAARYEPEGPTA
ncbi:two-component sensor histidine kinase [Mangrovihabitans endophyticus]|uniref:histidine kinase n=2 Tax=Mangrovihabitans endophyticus TaxID=1751298 RepID=A0A8J3BUQ9_9ACTN|nr:two-component sensor histidine kinase [Mangrovihabitans endophyticus]